MPKKTTSKKTGSPSTPREKAAQLRASHERADKRMRTIVVSVVLAIVLAVVLVVSYAISQQIQADSSAASPNSAAVLGPYADGAPIVLTPGGIGEADPAIPTLTEYFDYTCRGCAAAELLFGNEIAEDVKAGKYNVAYQPVSAHAPYQHAAVGASLVVAQKSPEQWHDFHHELMVFFDDQMQKGEGRIIGDFERSVEKVREIALSVGVAQEVTEAFSTDGVKEYLQKAGESWSKTEIEGREGFYTPEFVADGTRIVKLPSFRPDEALGTIRHGLNAP